MYTHGPFSVERVEKECIEMGQRGGLCVCECGGLWSGMDWEGSGRDGECDWRVKENGLDWIRLRRGGDGMGWGWSREV